MTTTKTTTITLTNSDLFDVLMALETAAKATGNETDRGQIHDLQQRIADLWNQSQRSTPAAENPTARTEVLDTARAIVTGDRQADYGDATESFALIARLWSAVLGHEILPHEVALCLAQLKIARITHNPTIRDSWVDGIGYLALGAEIADA